MTAAAPTSQSLRSALAGIPTPVTAVGAVIDGEPLGMVVGSFVGLSLDPPLVAISIQATSTTWPELRKQDRLGISVLNGAHTEVTRQLAGPRSQRFDGVPWSDDDGAVLLDESETRLSVHLINEVDTGDHSFAILEVDDISTGVLADGEQPLVFHRSALQQVGPSA